jgi:flagellar assembly protein FliH
MKNLYNASVPFALQDLETGGERVEKAAFVSLFPCETTSQDVEEVEAEAEKPISEETPDTLEAEPAAEPADEQTPSIEDLTRKAFEDAYTQGEKAGYEMGMRRVESIAKRLEKQIEEVLVFKQELARNCERLSTDLALAFTEALVLKECSEQRDILSSMIKKALEACEDRDGLVIRVRSEDVRYLEGLVSDHIRIVPDDTLKEPGFVIETKMGDIDGKISTQIEELKNALVGYHGE